MTTEEEKKATEDAKIRKAEIDIEVAKLVKEALSKDKSVPISRLNEEIEKRKGLETELKGVADRLIEDIPEDFKALVPDLPSGKLIPWLKDATAKGLFTSKDVNNDSVDTKIASDKKVLDSKDLSPIDRIATGYKK